MCSCEGSRQDGEESSFGAGGWSVEGLLGLDCSTLTAGELADAVLAFDRLRSRVETALGRAVAVFDAQGVWGLDGAVNPTQWFTARADMRRPEAAAVVRFARLGREFPATAAAADHLGASKVRVMLSAVNRRTRTAYERDEALLLEWAEPLSVDQVFELMRAWTQRVDQDGPEPRVPDGNELTMSPTLEGRWRGRFDLDPETGATLRTALADRADVLFRAQQACTETEGAPVNGAQRLGEAFAMLIRDATAHHPGAGETAVPAFTIIMDIDTLEGRAGRTCRIPGVGPLRGDSARRLACDAAINRLITDAESAILDAGRTTYTPNRAQRRALVARDGGCGWHGCDMPPTWCDAHHTIFWGTQQGPTDIDKLILLCRRHHRLVHEGHWQIQRTPHGQTVIHRPDGTILHPPQHAFRPHNTTHTHTHTHTHQPRNRAPTPA